MRSNASDTFAGKSTCVWLKEMAFPTLFDAASMRDICAFNFIETARPALSSAGEVIFEPEDSLARDLLNSELEAPSKPALVCADMFVLMTILTPSMSHPCGDLMLHGISAVRWAITQAPTCVSFRLFAAARRRFPTTLYRPLKVILEW
ncbi:MAG: hypothetical protein U1F98_04125 [Verrucomicrobiota bacterium]